MPKSSSIYGRELDAAEVRDVERLGRRDAAAPRRLIGLDADRRDVASIERAPGRARVIGEAGSAPAARASSLAVTTIALELTGLTRRGCRARRRSRRGPALSWRARLARTALDHQLHRARRDQRPRPRSVTAVPGSPRTSPDDDLERERGRLRVRRELELAPRDRRPAAPATARAVERQGGATPAAASRRPPGSASPRAGPRWPPPPRAPSAGRGAARRRRAATPDPRPRRRAEVAAINASTSSRDGAPGRGGAAASSTAESRSDATSRRRVPTQRATSGSPLHRRRGAITPSTTAPTRTSTPASPAAPSTASAVARLPPGGVPRPAARRGRAPRPSRSRGAARAAPRGDTGARAPAPGSPG